MEESCHVADSRDIVEVDIKTLGGETKAEQARRCLPVSSSRCPYPGPHSEVKWGRGAARDGRLEGGRSETQGRNYSRNVLLLSLSVRLLIQGEDDDDDDDGEDG